ncbi:MAG: acyltransferase [Nostoc sp.]|uniref:acyltransferase family protein n=1 Tax=Nostoc sp. TaxID=1180 RepID=UPI002FF59944
MQTQSKLKSQLVQLDVIRGLAIIGVFLFHLYGYTFDNDEFPFLGNFRDYSQIPNSAFLIFSPYQYGYLGVTLFFILSGFCIHLSFLRYTSTLEEKGIIFRFDIFVKDFFIKRFFRIYPAYLVALLLFSFVSFVFKIDFDTPLKINTEGIIDFFSHIFLIQNFSELTLTRINPSFWSIPIEFQLYIIYPLFLILRNKLGITKATLVIFVFQVLYSPLALELDRQIDSIGHDLHLLNKIKDLISSLSIFNNSPLNYWFTWVIGAYLAENILSKNKKILNFSFKHNLFFLILFIISYEYKPFSTIGNLAIIFLFASLIEIYIIDRKKIGFIENSIAKIGLCSYSIYLFNEPLIMYGRACIEKLFKLLFNFNFQYLQHPYFMCTLGAVAIFIPIFIISWFSYKYLEIPTHRLGRRLVQGKGVSKAIEKRI